MEDLLFDLVRNADSSIIHDDHAYSGDIILYDSDGSYRSLDDFRWEDRAIYMSMIQRRHLQRSAAHLSAVWSGLASVLPVEIFSIFSAGELELLFCGKQDVDIDLLMSVTEYDSGIKAEDAHVQYFWNALKSFSPEERAMFVKFSSACSRLPSSASEFRMPFRILKPEPQAETDPDRWLPRASTCFFSLTLPKYSSQEVATKKLRQAIHECKTMDNDFVDREGWEGWERL